MLYLWPQQTVMPTEEESYDFFMRQFEPEEEAVAAVATPEEAGPSEATPREAGEAEDTDTPPKVSGA